MKNNYFIIHGTFGSQKDHWFLWLKEELIKRGFKVTVPSFKTIDGENNYRLREEILKEYLERGEINENTVFIGHSSGPIVVCKFLIEHNVKVKGLISVSGFNNFNGPFEEYNRVNQDFFIENEKLKKIYDYLNFVYTFYSDNDPYLSIEVLETFANITKAEKAFISEAGHFNTDSGYTEFKELLTVIKQIEDGLSLMEANDLPVGINFIIQNEKKEILLGRRINRFGAGTYALFGEKLKNGESIEQCAVRGAKEELGIEVLVEDVEVINFATTYTNTTFIQIAVLINKYKGIPSIMEPHKCDDLKYFNLEDLPKLFIGAIANVELFKKNIIYDRNVNINKNE